MTPASSAAPSHRLKARLLTLAVAACIAAPALADEPAADEQPARVGLKPAPDTSFAADQRLTLAAGLEMPARHGDIPSTWMAQNDKPGTISASAQRDWTSPTQPKKSYLIPAAEIIGFQTLLNLADRAIFGCCDYDVTLNTIQRNFNGRWVYDNDPYTVNQLGHPYQGSMYHTFARSAGLNFWESLAYTFAGSAVWEIAGETTPPSKNDQITTGIGGAFLGESLYRMANLVLEKGGGLSPKWREVVAAAISPATGFNRLAFGNRFDSIWPSRSAAYYSRLALGATHAIQESRGTSGDLKRNEGVLDFSLDYGLPGQPGYKYERPFDYFSFQATASTGEGFENLMTRGLLIGKDYDSGNRYKGVWGLYGSFDYISPQFFRISSTALSLGTTAEWRVTDKVAIQGTVLGGAGYASVSTINGLRDNDYHFGIAPQALASFRLIFGNTASLDITGREYFVSDVATDRQGRDGHDNIARADIALTWRIHKQHAVSVRYIYSHRDANYPDLGDRSQSRGTIGIFYTLLGQDRFGSPVDWR
ncbi:MAG TPA: DUF3943 domain-containing protein [Burkholderiales bacterium]|nr:DUF3943 domain-containing protein [Burkholderiales bacterium]